jgi:hypothetical protein
VLLPAWLFSRRAYAGVVIWACVLARAAGMKVAAIGARAGVAVSTAASWLRRVAGRAEWWRQVLMGVLALVDAQVRRVVPGASPLADVLAVLEAVTIALRAKGGPMATVTSQEVASHLTRGHLLAPFLDLDGCNTSLFWLPAATPS